MQKPIFLRNLCPCMKIIFIALSLISITAFSRSGEEDEVKAVILGFFDAMHASDSTAIRNSLTTQAVFQTISAENEVKTSSVSSFIASIGKAPKGSLDEKISFESVLIDGTLASVWTPYRFYVNGSFSHCGVNFFSCTKKTVSGKSTM